MIEKPPTSGLLILSGNKVSKSIISKALIDEQQTNTEQIPELNIMTIITPSITKEKKTKEASWKAINHESVS